ncbi:hypothetical protein D3C78_1216790 [compost metagenome]
MREQRLDIQRRSQHRGLIDGGRHLPPGLRQLRVGFALLEHQCQDCQCTLLVFIDKVRLKGELLTVNFVFARGVEVKLLQRESVVIQHQGIAAADVYLHGMAVIDDLLFAWLESQFQFVVLGFQSTFNINR